MVPVTRVTAADAHVSRHRAEPVAGYAGPAMLQVTGLTVRFGALHVLDEVNLSIRPGELLAVAGENGAGKSTLVRCVAGDLAATRGRVEVGGHRVAVGRSVLRHPQVGVVWQTPAQCDNLDVAANVMLGNERRWLLHSHARTHAAAAMLLADLAIPIRDTTRSMQSLSRSEQQLIAIARAVRDRPALLVLDEPTGLLGAAETALVEGLIARLHRAGSTIMLVSHDIGQMMRLADRVAVLHRGSVIAQVDPALSHPDEIAALVAGQQVDSSARRQLLRLQDLVDQLASGDASSGLPLILSALGAALGVDRLCLHLCERGEVRLAASLGMPREQQRVLRRVPVGAAGGPVGVAAQTGHPAVDFDGSMRRAAGWRELADGERAVSCYSVPVLRSAEVLGVITVFHREPGAPPRDELDLVALYTGYAAGAVERDRLLGQVTARNRVLETIRVALQALTGPAALDVGLHMALQALRDGTGASSVTLFTRRPDGRIGCAARVEMARGGGDGAALPSEIPSGASQSDDVRAATALAEAAVTDVVPSRVSLPDSVAAPIELPTDLPVELSESIDPPGLAVSGPDFKAVTFASPNGPAVLVARWPSSADPPEDSGLLEDAAQCLRLAFERQDADSAREQAAALRRSQQLQRDFLSRLSHELRTPLTAIRGYASSLTQPDVTWDSQSQQRFLTRISAESDRLGRLVGDLLDFSAIEAGVLRLHRDWCELPLVLEAASSCVPQPDAPRVRLRCEPDLPAVWADHDRLEQVFVNLIDNAIRHNPPGTSVLVEAERDGGGVAITVTDDGAGLPTGMVGSVIPPGHHGPGSGSGLGLSITRGIVQAHHGTIGSEPVACGARLRVWLPESPPFDEMSEAAG